MSSLGAMSQWFVKIQGREVYYVDVERIIMFYATKGWELSICNIWIIMIILEDIIIAPQIITTKVENLLHFHPLFGMH